SEKDRFPGIRVDTKTGSHCKFTTIVQQSVADKSLTVGQITSDAVCHSPNEVFQLKSFWKSYSILVAIMQQVLGHWQDVVDIACPSISQTCSVGEFKVRTEYGPCTLKLTFFFFVFCRCILYLYHGYNSKIHHKGIKQLGHYINITYLNHGYQSKQKISKKDYHYIEMIINEMYASLLSMFDAFIESAPQLLLQIYLILKEQENFKDCEHISIYSYIIRLFAVLTSWISVTWSVTAFYRAHRVTNDMHKTRQKTVFAAMGYFLWRAFEIGSRVMALVMIFLMNGIIFAMAVVIHWIVMVIFSFATKTRPYEKNHQNVIFILFVGFVQIFSFMNASRFKFPYHTVDDNHAEEVNPLESSDHAEEVNPHDKCYPTEPRHHALLYYLFVYTENIVILIVWILVKNNSFCPWIYHGSIGIVSSGLICNIVFMISYYKLCHPTISIFR
ncbi:XK-related protein 6-like, partial [Saccostrea cucullata]|uniref:XK-related protein 6-like n=1 Tax=Saccostrea cuccullata TaxID=36930 RepID=UPI002ED3493E